MIDEVIGPPGLVFDNVELADALEDDRSPGSERLRDGVEDDLDTFQRESLAYTSLCDEGSDEIFFLGHNLRELKKRKAAPIAEQKSSHYSNS